MSFTYLVTLRFVSIGVGGCDYHQLHMNAYCVSTQEEPQLFLQRLHCRSERRGPGRRARRAGHQSAL